MHRELMDGYIGVKYDARSLSDEMPDDLPAAQQSLATQGLRLAALGMAPQNGGNMSLRLETGFAITASGSNLGRLAPLGEVVAVERCQVEGEQVVYRGPRPPSSEALMHHLVLEAFPECAAVVHAHDPATNREAQPTDVLVETAQEEPYGTLALAREAVEAFGRGARLILLKNHGYVAVGETLAEAVDLIIATHEVMVSAQGATLCVR